MLLTAGAMAQTPIALNYNFNGLVHAGEAGQPDSASGFRGISDRALVVDGAAGSLGTASIVGGTGLPYTIITTPGILDLVHLGDRARHWAYETTIPGANANVGIRPTWDASSDHTGIQTTVIALGLPMFANSELGFLYQISNSGGAFDVILGFSDGSSVTVRLAGPDWFGTPTVAAGGPGVTRQARLGGNTAVWTSANNNDSGTIAPTNQRLSVIEGVMTAAQIQTAGFGNIAGKTLTSIGFGNAVYPAPASAANRGYAIFAATHRGSAVFPPTASGAATPANVIAGQNTLLTVTPVLGSGSPNNITTVTVDASSLVLGTVPLNDNGINGDLTAGDGIWSRSITLPGATAATNYTLPFSVTDAQARTATGSIGLSVVVPPVATDLGTLPTGRTSVTTDLASGGINWVKFTLAAPVDAAALKYLDIDSEGSALSNNDTEIGLYNDAGGLISTDDDDGSGNNSQLSFGVASPARPAVGNGLGYNGRDGALLPAGTYYLASGAFNSNFNPTLWNVTTTATGTGPITLNISIGAVPAGGIPAVSTNLGTIGATPVTATSSINTAGEVRWFRFTLDAAVNTANREYLDLDTEGSGIFDTVMGLFRDDGTGTLVATDNDSGSQLQSQLSFGRGTRDPFEDSNAYDGRNGGTLAAGTYYVAISENPALFGNNFVVWLSGGTNTGTVNLNVRRGVMPPPTPTIVAGPILNPANGNNYYLFDIGLNWLDAEAAAVVLGGHLASIDDAGENEFVRTSVLSFDGADRRGWIGFTDQASEGNFTWSDGTPTAFTNWSGGEPNNSGGLENYAEMFGNGFWNDTVLLPPALNTFALVEVSGTTTSCLADVNGDLVVDGNDFVAFINSFGIGDPAIDAIADVNFDGVIDGNDFVAFINAFAAGC